MKTSRVIRSLMLSLALLASFPSFAAVKKRVQRLLDDLCRLDALGRHQQRKNH